MEEHDEIRRKKDVIRRFLEDPARAYLMDQRAILSNQLMPQIIIPCNNGVPEFMKMEITYPDHVGKNRELNRLLFSVNYELERLEKYYQNQLK